jgi:hypothetical protein
MFVNKRGTEGKVLESKYGSESQVSNIESKVLKGN